MFRNATPFISSHCFRQHILNKYVIGTSFSSSLIKSDWVIDLPYHCHLERGYSSSNTNHNFKTTDLAVSRENNIIELKKQLKKTGFKLPSDTSDVVKFVERGKKLRKSKTTKLKKRENFSSKKSIRKFKQILHSKKLTAEQMEDIESRLTSERMEKELIPVNDEHTIELIKHGRIVPRDIKEDLNVTRDENGTMVIDSLSDPGWNKITDQIMTPESEYDVIRDKYVKSLPAEIDTYFLHKPKNIYTFNNLIRIQSAQKKSDLAEKSIENMLQLGIQPDIYSYHGVIHALSNVGDYKKALQYLVMMENRGLKPNIHTYGSIVNSLVKGKQLEKAFDVVEVMRSNGIKPNVVVSSMLIKACIDNGDLKRAWNYHQRMMAFDCVKPDEITYTILIQACIKSGEGEKAYSLFNDLEIAGLKPTGVTYLNLIKALSKRKATRKKAIEVFHQMEANGYKPTIETYSLMISTYAKDADVKHMIEIYEKMRASDIKLNEYVYSSMFHCLAKYQKNFPKQNTNIETAMKLYNQLQQDSVAVNYHVLNSLLQVYTLALRHQDAIHFLQTEFPKHEMQPNNITYTILITMYSKMQWMNEAMGMFDHFAKNNIKPTYGSYKSIIFGFLRLGMFQKAQDWLRNMFKRDGYMLRPEDIVIFRRLLRKNRRKAVDIEALKYLEEFPTPEMATANEQKVGPIKKEAKKQKM